MKTSRVTLIFFIFSAILFHWSCSPDEKTLTAPFDGLSEFLKISSFTADNTQLIANTDSTIVRAVIVNSSDEPAKGVPVTFSASSGDIIAADTSGFALTNAAGLAQAKYKPSADYGIAHIYVQAGFERDTLSITVAPQELFLQISVDDDDIHANGHSQTAFTVTAVDQYDSPLQGMEVHCTTSAGFLLDADVITSSFGSAAFTLRSSVSSVNVQAQLECVLTSNEEISAAASVDFIGLTIEVTASEEFIEAEQESVTITAQVTETNSGSPVINETVYWSTTLGMVDNSSVTNSMGMAQTTLTPLDGQTGTATVTGSIGSGAIEGQTQVYFVATSISSVDLSVSNTHILADGLSTTSVYVNALDDTDNPATFVSILFSTDAGSFSNGDQEIVALTNNSGLATVQLTSAVSAVDLTANISAEATVDQNITDTGSLVFKGITFHITTILDTLIADGSTITEITAQAKETTNGNPLIGQTVNWGTNLGVITGTSQTNNFGFTSSQLMSGLEEGHAIVSAWIGPAGVGLSDTVEFEFISLSVSHLSLSAAPSSLLANGLTQSVLTITAFDEIGNTVPGIALTVVTDHGRFSNNLQQVQAVTGSNGTAAVTLTSEASVINLAANIIVSAVNDLQVQSQAQVIFRGISFSITSDLAALIADGNTVTTVSALIKETATGNPVVGGLVSWGTSLGVITSNSTSNQFGVATAQLYASYETGDAVLQASYGDLFTDQDAFEFVMLSVSDIEVDAVENSLLADGMSSTDISVTAVDASGTAVPYSPVIVTTDHGLFSNGTQTIQLTTNSQGTGMVTLTSTESLTDLTAVISATYPGDESLAAVEEVVFRGLTLTIVTQIDSLIADGTSINEITARLTETTNSLPVAGKTISWTTTLGEIEESTITNSLGLTTADLTNSPVTGETSVQAVFGSTISDTINFDFVPVTVTAIEMDILDEVILADGVSTSGILISAADAQGNPVAGANISVFAVSGTFNNGEPEYETTTNGSGSVQITLTSSASAVDMAAIISASIVDAPDVVAYGIVEFKGVTFEITTSLDALIADGLTITAVSALVKETTTGNPITGKTVFWSTNLGVITGSATTNQFGIASSQMVSSYTTGPAIVTARFGNELIDTLEFDFVLAGITDVSFTSYQNTVLADGLSTIVFSALVTDATGEPLSAAAIEFSTEAGSFSNGQQSLQVTSNDEGMATATVTSVPSAEDIQSTVTVLSLANSEALDTMDIIFRGIMITITTDIDTLVADGQTNTVFTAHVRETTSQTPLVNESVVWNTNLGLVTTLSTTNQFGVATTILTSSPIAGLASLTASVGQTVTAAKDLMFIPLAIDSIDLWTSATYLYADGFSTAEFRITARDELGNLMQGEDIVFFTDLGTFDNGQNEITVTTDIEGIATANLTSVTSSSQDLVADILIFAASDPTVNLTFQMVFIALEIYIDTEAGILIADIDTVTPINAYVVESTTGNPVVERAVYFTTTIGSITGFSLTDEYGGAVAELISYDETGLATVHASFGPCINNYDNCISDYIECQFINAQVPTTILITAIGGEDNENGTATVPFSTLLLDENSYGISNYNINYTVTPTGWGVLDPPSSLTNNIGLASGSYTWSREYDGNMVSIISTAYTESGFLSDTIFVELIIIVEE